MITNGQKLALIPLNDRINAVEQVLVYETTAAKATSLYPGHAKRKVRR